MKEIVMNIKKSDEIIEVIISDIFVNVNIRLSTKNPITTVEGQVAFDKLKDKLSYCGHKISKEIMDNIE